MRPISYSCPAPTTTIPFDLLMPFAHTVLVFELRKVRPPPTANPLAAPLQLLRTTHLDGRGKYDKDGHCLMDSYLVLPENTLNPGSGRAVEDVNRVLVDTQRSRPEDI